MKTLIAILTIIGIIFFLTRFANASIGLVADIHAGKEKVRTNSNGSNVYPKKGVGVFKRSLQVMKQKGVDFVIVLGDSTNSNSDKYAKRVKNEADKSKMTVLFVKGNHDKDGFRYLSKETYYVREIKGKKIMVLDTTYADHSSFGEISPSQKEWVYQNIKGVDILAMHHPVLDEGVVIPRYQWLYDLVRAENVQKVYSGHTHSNYQHGVYRGVGALTNEGYVIDNF